MRSALTIDGMMTEGSPIEDLHEAWRVAAAAGALVHEFQAVAPDPHGRWDMGHRVRFGLVWDHDRRETRFEASNLSTWLPLSAEIPERPVDHRGFRCQLNSFRVLRPGALTIRRARAPGLATSAEGCRFYCQDDTASLSLLRRKPLAHVHLGGGRWNAYPNAAPLHKDGHLIWVPVDGDGDRVRLPHRPQRLGREELADLLDLALALQDQDYLVFFNGVAAGASVDHVHVHALARSEPLAIERARVTQYRACTILRDYPARGFIFRADAAGDRAALAAWADQLQRRGVPINLIVARNRAFLIPRVFDSETSELLPGAIVASIELAGTFVVDNPDIFASVAASTLHAVLERSTLCPRLLIDRWG